MSDLHTPVASTPAARSAAEPFTFAGTVGLFTEAEGLPRPFAILFASAWGLEEMCSRKFFRILAERFAEEGIASLRFDYPGTGDAIEDGDAGSGISPWCDAVVAAAERLQARSGCARVVIVAQGVGAMLAAQAAARISGLEGIAYLAPVVSGRSYIRELTAFSKMINDKLGLNPEAEGAIEIAGLSLSLQIANSLRGIDLLKRDKITEKTAIVFSKSGAGADEAFAEHLARMGASVVMAPFEGYEKLTSNPTTAVVPAAVVLQLVSWVCGLAPRTGRSDCSATLTTTSSHRGPGYTETVLRFGRNERLFGIHCAPNVETTKRTPTVLLVSAGYDRLSGWGRSTVELARSLARANIRSLRFDCANVADSPPVCGFAGQVLYDDAQIADVQEAVDYLEGRGMTPVVAAGRCSGAYLGFQACLQDHRIVGLVGVNPVVFQWQKGRSVDAALENPTQSLEHYGHRLFDWSTLKRILRGEVKLIDKGLEIGGRLAGRTVRPMIRAVGGVSARERAVFAGFRDLRDRNVNVCLLYSAGDIGLDELTLFFGKDIGGINRFQNVRSSVVKDSDHNFTPRHARAAYLEAIVSTVASVRQALSMG